MFSLSEFIFHVTVSQLGNARLRRGGENLTRVVSGSCSTSPTLAFGLGPRPAPALVTCVMKVLPSHDKLPSLFRLKSLTRKHRSAIVRIFNLTDVDDVLGGRSPG